MISSPFNNNIRVGTLAVRVRSPKTCLDLILKNIVDNNMLLLFGLWVITDRLEPCVVPIYCFMVGTTPVTAACLPEHVTDCNDVVALLYVYCTDETQPTMS